MRQLFREFAAAALRTKDRSELDLIQAWQTVRIWVASHKKNGLQVPELSKLLNRKTRSDRQTPQQMSRALRMLSKQYGGRLRAVTHGR